jgi:hypothetical protein
MLLLLSQVMSVIMQQLGIPIPVYIRRDRVQLSHTAKLTSSSGQQQAEEDSSEEEEDEVQQGVSGTSGLSGSAAAAAADGSTAAADTAAAANGDTRDNSSSSWSFAFSISSLHGLSCPLPMVASATVSFLGAAAAAGLKPRQLSGRLPWRLSRSCPAGLQQVQLQVQLALVDAADEGRRNVTVSSPCAFAFLLALLFQLCLTKGFRGPCQLVMWIGCLVMLVMS